MFFEQQIRILEWFLKDNLTGLMMLKSQLWLFLINCLTALASESQVILCDKYILNKLQTKKYIHFFCPHILSCNSSPLSHIPDWKAHYAAHYVGLCLLRCESHYYSWSLTPPRICPFETKSVLQNLNQYIVFCERVNKMIFTSFWKKKL